MSSQLKRWFARPPADDPGETMRWVRRVSVASGAFGLLLGAQLLAQHSPVGWVVIGAALVSLSSWVTMRPAIRRAEERGPTTDPAVREAGRRRARRFTWVMTAVIAVCAFAVGYVLEGLGVAAVAGVLGLASGSLGIWQTHRWTA